MTGRHNCCVKKIPYLKLRGKIAVTFSKLNRVVGRWAFKI